MATTITSAELVRVDDPLNFTERAAIAGFLAGYTGNTLVSYTTWVPALRRMVHQQRPSPPRRASRPSGDLRAGPWKPTAAWAPPSPDGSPHHALISLLALNGLRISEALGADIESIGMHRGQRTMAIVRKGGKHVTIRSPHVPAGLSICTSMNGRPARSSSVSTDNAWIATPLTGL